MWEEGSATAGPSVCAKIFAMVAARRNVAVLLAGGVGSRVGASIPKQLIKVAGRPIMEHTLAALDAHPDVDDIIVMMTPGHLADAREMVERGGFRKVRHVLEGAESRSHTSQRALSAIEADGDPKVLTHDAVRPLVSARIISDCYRALDTCDAVDVAIRSRDTIVAVDEGEISSSYPRATVRRGQTPQAFRLSVLTETYKRAMADPEFEPADDCTVVHRYMPEVEIRVVDGEPRNMKVTEPLDIFMAEKLFQQARRDTMDHMMDEDSFRARLDGKAMVIFGGAYGVGADIAERAAALGARVRSFGRSTTRTRIERSEDVKKALRQARDEFGAIDFVVNAASLAPAGHVVEASDEALYGAVDVNYLGPIFVARESFPYLRASAGSLVFLSSAAYTRGRAGNGLHSSASAALVNLTQALAEEWGPEMVRVNCVILPETSQRWTFEDPGVEPSELDGVAEPFASTPAILGVLTSIETGQIVDLPGPLAWDEND